jgi:hypothetical protein
VEVWAVWARSRLVPHLSLSLSLSIGFSSTRTAARPSDDPVRFFCPSPGAVRACGEGAAGRLISYSSSAATSCACVLISFFVSGPLP